MTTGSIRFSRSSARVLSALTLLFTAGCAISMAQEPNDNNGTPKASTKPKHQGDFSDAPVAGRVNVAVIANLVYFGGRVVSNPQYYNIYWGGNVSHYNGNIDFFVRDMGTLEFNSQLSQYSTTGHTPGTNQTIGLGSFGGSIIATPSAQNSGSTVDDTAIQSQLQAWIAAATIPAPQHDAGGNNNTIYNVLFPPGVTITQGGTSSCVAGGFCAYHGTVAGGVTPEFYYTVMPDQGPTSGCFTGCGNSPTPLQNLTSVLSHEIGETITDAEVGLATVVGPPLAWYDATNGENGDICNAQQGTMTGPTGLTWTVQLLWSNAQNACALPQQVFQILTFNALPNRTVGTAPFTVTATASTGFSVNFTGGTANICSVTPAGLVTILGAGQCSITANQPGGPLGSTNYAAAPSVTQSFSITAGGGTPQTITFAALSNRVLGTAPFTISATASSGLTVSFASTTATVCTVSGNTVTLVAVGQCSIQATQAGNATFAPAPPVTRSFQVTAGLLPQTIAFAALSNRVLGTAPFTVTATASSGLTVSFASTTAPVCTVSGSTVTLVAVGQCSIQATQAGNTTYAPAPAVTQSFQVTTAGPPPAGIVNGGFETGNLSGWTSTGTAVAVTPGHSGSFAARVGSTSPSTDSSIAQTFTAPTAATTLTFWYKVVCPDTLTYDWASATLKDNTAGTTATALAKTCTNSQTWVQSTTGVTAGHSYTLTLANHDDNFASDPTYTLYDDVTVNTGTPPPPPPSGITNGGFETGTLSGWTPAGTASVVAHPHSGSWSAQVGGTAPTNGDSTVTQTFAAPAAVSQLSLYYNVHCPDTITFDWAMVTLRDNTAGTTSTVVAKTCTNTGNWVNATAPVTPGHSYTLTLLSHDDNFAGDPTYTWYDDVTLK